VSSNSPGPSGTDAPLPDPNSTQIPVTSMSVAIGMMIGLAFLVLILMRRFGSSTDPHY
jgi:hypothetical protein